MDRGCKEHSLFFDTNQSKTKAMDIRKVNKVLDITEQRAKVIRFRDAIEKRTVTVNLRDHNNNTLLIVSRTKDEEDASNRVWKVINTEIKDLESAEQIASIAEWFADRVLNLLNEQIEEYDKQILSL